MNPSLIDYSLFLVLLAEVVMRLLVVVVDVAHQVHFPEVRQKKQFALLEYKFSFYGFCFLL